MCVSSSSKEGNCKNRHIRNLHKLRHKELWSKLCCTLLLVLLLRFSNQIMCHNLLLLPIRYLRHVTLAVLRHLPRNLEKLLQLPSLDRGCLVTLDLAVIFKLYVQMFAGLCLIRLPTRSLHPSLRQNNLQSFKWMKTDRIWIRC